MRIRLRPALIGVALAAMVSCGADSELPLVVVPDGMLMTEFPIVNGAVWVYENEADASQQYRLSVQGTRTISSYVHYKTEYAALDAAGNPLAGEAPPASDFFAANGLHRREGALTQTPGAFTTAQFLLRKAEDGSEAEVGYAGPVVYKAAATRTFPVGAAFVRKSLGTNLDDLGINDDPDLDGDDGDDPGDRLTRNRYDEVNVGTLGYILESASEGAGGNQFQKHLPPRRLWEFPMRVGATWTVFETPELTGKKPQPAVRVQRRVVREEDVSTPHYTGPALVVAEWVIGLAKDSETGESIVPSIDDEDGNGIPDRGEPTARYWVAPGVGVAKYEYEEFDLAAFSATGARSFARKTFVLNRASIPAGAKADGPSE